MTEFDSDLPRLTDANVEAAGDTGSFGDAAYDGVTAQDAVAGPGDIDDSAFEDVVFGEEFETVDLTQVGGETTRLAQAGGGVALLERTEIDDRYGPIDRSQGAVYSSTWAQESAAEPDDEPPTATDLGGTGRPPGPPKEPGSGSSEFDGGEEGPNDDNGNGDEQAASGRVDVPTVPLTVFEEVSSQYPALSSTIGTSTEATDPGDQFPRYVGTPQAVIPSATSAFDAFTPVLHPDDATPPEAGNVAFTPEADMLRRMELMADVGQLVTFRAGASEGRAAAAEDRAQAELAAQQAEAQAAAEAAARERESAPVPIVDRPGESGGTIELTLDLPAGRTRIAPLEPTPTAAEAAAAEATASPEELGLDALERERAAATDKPAAVRNPDGTYKQEPNPWSAAADDDTLMRILAGIRGAEGQQDAGAKEQVGAVDPSQITAEELEAAGGDITVAIANRAAQMRAQQQEPGDQQ